MRVVLDTNVVVSGILSATGASRALLELASTGRMEVVTSPTLLEELEDVLGRFIARDAAAEVGAAIEELARLADPDTVPSVTRDPDDDHVLAAAVAGGAAYIVTRDSDLLTLGEYRGVRILQPAPALHAIRDEVG